MRPPCSEDDCPHPAAYVAWLESDRKHSRLLCASHAIIVINMGADLGDEDVQTRLQLTKLVIEEEDESPDEPL